MQLQFQLGQCVEEVTQTVLTFGRVALHKRKVTLLVWNTCPVPQVSLLGVPPDRQVLLHQYKEVVACVTCPLSNERWLEQLLDLKATTFQLQAALLQVGALCPSVLAKELPP